MSDAVKPAHVPAWDALVCNVLGCVNAAKADGLCGGHLQELRRPRSLPWAVRVKILEKVKSLGGSLDEPEAFAAMIPGAALLLGWYQVDPKDPKSWINFK